MKSSLQILLIGILIILTGCVTLYKPNSVHSPLLKEKGDFSSSASLGFSGCGLFNLQSAYAISKHTGIMVDGMYHFKNSNTNDSTGSGNEKLRIVFGEVGAGYFTTLGNNKERLFQCYGGGGYGITTDRITGINQPTPPEVDAKYFNIFIQPGFAFTSKNFELAFDLKANYVHLFDLHAYLYDKFEWWNTDFKFYSDTTLDFMNLEPSVTIKAGGKKLKAIFQAGLIIPTVNSNSYFDVNTSSMLIAPLFKFSAGINYTFGRK